MITYFRDDAMWVEQIVREMLTVREGIYRNMADLLDDREFGYRSAPFFATIPPAGYGTSRDNPVSNMVEHPSLAPTVVEVQSRSVLEHAWAEAEHDIYKQPDEATVGTAVGLVDPLTCGSGATVHVLDHVCPN